MKRATRKRCAMTSPALNRGADSAEEEGSRVETVSTAAVFCPLETSGRRKLSARSCSLRSSSTTLLAAGSPWHAWSTNLCRCSGFSSSASAKTVSTDCLSWPTIAPNQTHGRRQSSFVSCEFERWIPEAGKYQGKYAGESGYSIL